MVRTHLSEVGSVEELIALLPQICRSPHGVALKPNGIWYQVDDEWEKWIEGENWAPREYKHKYLVGTSKANILKLSTAEEVIEFQESYKARMYPEATIYNIDWGKVQGIWDGIEISPYFHELRSRVNVDMLWYYGWDVASGVVWNYQDLRFKYLGKFVPSVGTKLGWSA